MVALPKSIPLLIEAAIIIQEDKPLPKGVQS
jgi:hypothetical protein